MTVTRTRLVIFLINLQVIANALIFCVHVSFFYKDDTFGIGLGLFYAAYMLLGGMFALLADLVFWIVLRKKIAELVFLRNIAVWSFAFAFILCCLAVWPWKPAKRWTVIESSPSTHTTALPPSARTDPAGPESAPSNNRSTRTTGN